MSRPPENHDSDAESTPDGLRDEIEEILRERGEKPVLPRPPRAGGRGTPINLAGVVRNMAGGTDGNGSPVGALMRTAVLLMALRIALGLAFTFIAFRALGPRAIPLMIVIMMAILALIIIRVIIARRRYSR